MQLLHTQKNVWGKKLLCRFFAIEPKLAMFQWSSRNTIWSLFEGNQTKHAWPNLFNAVLPFTFILAYRWLQPNSIFLFAWWGKFITACRVVAIVKIEKLRVLIYRLFQGLRFCGEHLAKNTTRKKQKCDICLIWPIYKTFMIKCNINRRKLLTDTLIFIFHLTTMFIKFHPKDWPQSLTFTHVRKVTWNLWQFYLIRIHQITQKKRTSSKKKKKWLMAR